MVGAAEGHELAVKNKHAEQAQDGENKSHEEGVAVIVIEVVEKESRHGREHHPGDGADHSPG